MAIPIVLVQELCEWADPIRQESVKKQRFKELLWDMLCDFIKTHASLQTNEEPSGAAASSKSKKKQEETWTAPDELSSFIRKMHPDWDERRIFIEKFLEEKCQPQFAAGKWPEEMGSCEDSPAWTEHGKDHV